MGQRNSMDLDERHVQHCITLPRINSEYIIRIAERLERNRSYVIDKLIETFRLSGSSFEDYTRRDHDHTPR